MARRASRRTKTTETKVAKTVTEAKVEKTEAVKKLPKAVKPLNGRKFSFAEKKFLNIKLSEVDLDSVAVDEDKQTIEFEAQIAMFDGELQTPGKVVIQKAEIGRKNWEFHPDKPEPEKAYALQQNLWYSTHRSGAKKQYIEVFDNKGNMLCHTKNDKPGDKTPTILAENPILKAAKEAK